MISGAKEYYLLGCDAPCGQVEIYQSFRQKCVCGFFFNYEIFSAMQLRCRSPWIRRCVRTVRDNVLSTSSRVTLTEINFWKLKIEDITFPENVGIRLPVSQRHIAEELNPCCLIYIICGAYMDKIGWSEIWYFCCRDNMESKKALPFVKGVQIQNVRETKREFHNQTSWIWGNIVFLLSRYSFGHLQVHHFN